jgi:hypothetical protein
VSAPAADLRVPAVKTSFGVSANKKARLRRT